MLLVLLGSGFAAVWGQSIARRPGRHVAAAAPAEGNGAAVEPACSPDWRTTYSPSGGTDTNNDYLLSVAAVSAADAWAVGYYRAGSVDRTLTEHWDGTNWRVVLSNTVGSGNNQFYSVAPVSSNDVWAVGYGAPDTLTRAARAGAGAQER